MGRAHPDEIEDGPLAALVADVLARMEREGSAALDDVCRAHPEHAERLRRRVLTLRQFGLVDAWTADRPPERLGDFRLVEKIGAGGMGVVFHAVQESLGREVALKLIRPEMLFLPGARQRFARETTIVARLQHPGIVPIYTVGGADELPYYAMERVQGCTLSEALATLGCGSSQELAGADLARAVRDRSSASAEEPESPLFAGSWEQACLRIVRQVAEALEHAHGRGVLHRDLKPSNVMVTPGGRVMLVDFGLSQSESSDSVTRSGERAGSLPYMPPELLRSGLRAVDKRSDVYSLGVTLYQLLTLHLPFEAESEPAVLAAILEGRPRHPRAHAPQLSWEAETVCLAAMERDPARRYASAADFARDLGNALEHRPIEARRASPWLRTRRWIETRPGASAAIALAVLTPTVIATLQVREAHRMGEALAATKLQETLAQANFERAMRAVESMLSRVGLQSLDHVPGAGPLRVELLGEAQAMYEELARERPGDASLAAHVVETGLLRADLLRRQGNRTEVEPLVRAMLARIEPWIAGAPYELRLARARALALLADTVRDPAESLALRNQALATYDEIARERPLDTSWLKDLIVTSVDVVLDARSQGQRQEMPVDLASLERLAREVLAREPGPDAQRILARVLGLRGFWVAREGRNEEALAPLRESLELRQRVLESDPSDEIARATVCESASNLSISLGGLKRYEEALVVLDLAARESDRNATDFPDVLDFEKRVADVALNRGFVLSALGREEEAIEAFEHALRVQSDIVERNPELANEQRTLGTILLNISSSQSDAGRFDEALATLELVRERFAEAMQLAPGDPDIAVWLALERKSRAGVLLASGRIAEAAEAVAEAPKLAGHRADYARECLKRMKLCLERARASGDPETIRRAEAAARVAIDLAVQRGDMANEVALADLRSSMVER